MVYKQARDKALQGAGRLIHGTYHGELWSTDAYFAIAGDIFSDYRLRTDQYIADSQPIMDAIIDEGSKYVPATSVAPNPDNKMDTMLVKSDDTTAYEVQRRYINAIKAYYPDATPFVQVDGYKFAPVRYVIDDKIIGVIMPLKR